MEWEASFLFALSISFVLQQGVIMIRAMHKREFNVNKISYVPYYFAMFQSSVGITYYGSLLMNPEEAILNTGLNGW